MRAGEVVLGAGKTIRSQEVALLAELGRAEPLVRRPPTIAILATGDELVSVDQELGPGQIRNSNEPMLAARIEAIGCRPVTLGIARDNTDDLSAQIERGLQHDILLLSGGVSAGKLDLVPSALESAGVQQVFHKVRVKPGKPIWFGTTDTTLVFGLPGNPVSSLVCFELFVRAAIRNQTGATSDDSVCWATLNHDARTSFDRPTYFPARVTPAEQGMTIALTNWIGSADIRSIVDANALAILPASESSMSAGDRIAYLPW